LLKPITGITRTTADRQRNEHIRRKVEQRERERAVAKEDLERCEHRVQAIKNEISETLKGLGKKEKSLEDTQKELVALVCTLGRLESKVDELVCCSRHPLA